MAFLWFEATHSSSSVVGSHRAHELKWLPGLARELMSIDLTMRLGTFFSLQEEE